MNAVAQKTKALFPSAISAEQSVLGSMLIERKAIDAAREIVSADDFERADHHELFETLCAITDSGAPVDSVTMTRELKSRKSSVEANYIMSLLDAVPSAANIEFYAKIVADTSKRRKIILACHEAAAFASQDDATAADAEERAMTLLAGVSGDKTIGSSELLRFPIMQVLDDAEANAERGGGITGIQTPFRQFDGMTSGLQPSNLIIVAARPSMGKTSLALSLAIHAGGGCKKAAIFSLEMDPLELARRLLSSAAAVDSRLLKQGKLSEQEWARVHREAGKMRDYQVFIDGRTNSTPNSILRECKRIQAHGGLDLIVIDYLQLIYPDQGRKGENRTQEVSEIARRLKSLARELKVPVIALSQLSRSVESRENKRPMLSDLRESGSIEAEADMVCFLYREAYYKNKAAYDETSQSRHKGEAEETELIVAKHRNGPTGMIKIAFVPDFAKFVSFEDIQDDAPTGF